MSVNVKGLKAQLEAQMQQDNPAGSQRSPLPDRKPQKKPKPVIQNAKLINKALSNEKDKSADKKKAKEKQKRSSISSSSHNAASGMDKTPMRALAGVLKQSPGLDDRKELVIGRSRRSSSPPSRPRSEFSSSYSSTSPPPELRVESPTGEVIQVTEESKQSLSRSFKARSTGNISTLSNDSPTARKPTTPNKPPLPRGPKPALKPKPSLGPKPILHPKPSQVQQKTGKSVRPRSTSADCVVRTAPVALDDAPPDDAIYDEPPPLDDAIYDELPLTQSVESTNEDQYYEPIDTSRAYVEEAISDEEEEENEEKDKMVAAASTSPTVQLLTVRQSKGASTSVNEIGLSMRNADSGYQEDLEVELPTEKVIPEEKPPEVVWDDAKVNF